MELKSNEETLKMNINHLKNILIFLITLLNKIDMLETKILPKANLLDSFSKSKS